MVSRSTNVLVVEDGLGDTQVLARELSRAGMHVVSAKGLSQTLTLLAAEGPDIVLVEMSDPTLHRLDMCRQIRKRSNVPIVVLAVPSPEIYVAVSLEIGADDYLTRPLETRQLVARIGMVLRRARQAPATSGGRALQIGDVRLDPQSHTVTVGEREVDFTRKEFAVLHVLLEGAGRVIPRRLLLERVWGSEFGGNDATLETHMKRVRAKIRNGDGGSSPITTVRGVGYLYDAAVAPAAEIGQSSPVVHARDT